MLFSWTRWIQFETSVVEGLLNSRDITAFKTFRKLNVIYLPAISKITPSWKITLKISYFGSLHAINLLIWKKC